jgi:hypothetical protein
MVSGHHAKGALNLSASPRASLAWDELLDWAGTRAADEDARWLRVDVWTTTSDSSTTTSSRASPLSASWCSPTTPLARCSSDQPSESQRQDLLKTLRPGFSRLSQRKP